MKDDFLRNLRLAVDRLVPSYVAAHNARGNELVDSGDFDAAIAEFDEAIRLTPSVAEIYSDRGRAHAVKGDVGLALADFDEAIRLRPQEADFYTNRGAARRMAGDDEGARRDSTRLTIGHSTPGGSISPGRE